MIVILNTSKHQNLCLNTVTPLQFNQTLRASQYEAELEKRDFEIQALRLEVDSLKDDLKLVKGRNKKLCEVRSLCYVSYYVLCNKH